MLCGGPLGNAAYTQAYTATVASEKLVAIAVAVAGHPAVPVKHPIERCSGHCRHHKPVHGAQMLELNQSGDRSGQDGKSKFDEVTKMWSAMSEEEKRAYTEDFKVPLCSASFLSS